MANTYSKRQLVVAGDNSFLAYHIRNIPEAASATFVSGAPVAWSSGYIAACADPVASASLVGFAQRAGRNGSSAGDYESEVLLAFPGMLIYANLLGAAGADNAVAATDLGTDFDIADDAVGPGSTVIHYAADESGDVTIQMVSRYGDQPIPNISGSEKWAASDVNPRALFQVLNSALAIEA